MTSCPHLPDKFSRLRPNQEAALADTQAVPPDTRLIGINSPTGSGKSAYAVAHALRSPGRWLILTSTKGLEDQYVADGFPVTDVRGRSNYDCDGERNCEEGAAAGCPYRATRQCPATDAVVTARNSRIVLTNYAMWFASRHSGGLGEFDGMILDEAHHAFHELSNAASVLITARETEEMLGVDFPDRAGSDPTASVWSKWATGIYQDAKDAFDREKADLASSGSATLSAVRRLVHWISLLRKLEALMSARGEWVDDQTRYGWKIDPLWPADYGEALLYRKVPRVILMSATITPGVLDLTGATGARAFFEYPYVFPRDRSPVYLLSRHSSVRVDHRMTPEHVSVWLSLIDNIIRRRQDRKGLIHAVSYLRAGDIRRRSEFRHLMWDHDSDSTAGVVEQFKCAQPPAVLVSPSLMTGWDFPGPAAEYGIVAKVPFPDSRDRVTKARMEKDKAFGNNLAAQGVMQACGRIMRSAEDRGESFIVDGHAGWLLRRAEVAKWFRGLVREVDVLPGPPMALGGS